MANDTSPCDLTSSLTEFAALYKGNPQVGEWSAGASLLAHQLSNSTDQAFGGELAYRYATQGSLDGEATATVHGILSNVSFGAEPTGIVVAPAMSASQSSSWTSPSGSAWRSSVHAQS